MIVARPMNRPLVQGALVLAIVLTISACDAATGSPSGSPAASSPAFSPGPSATISLPITTPDAAASLVIASDPRFNGIAKQDPNMVGVCCFYQASARGDGSFEVAVQIGWGDCPAGCINRHDWLYIVTADGTVTLDRETGLAVPPGVNSGGGAGGGGAGGSLPAGPGIAGQALAGPTCPVVKPGDPACNDRPVAGATILIRDGTGAVVAQMTTDVNGQFQLAVPAGQYVVEPQPVQGLMGTAPKVDVMVGGAFEVVRITYDTGIR